MREKLYRPLAVELGKLVIAWNSLHVGLMHLFGYLIDQSMAGVPDAIWHSTTNDRSQREMLRSALDRVSLPDARKRRPHVTDHFIAECLWILKETNVLAEERNSVVHSAYLLQIDKNKNIEVVPNFIMAGPKARALHKKGKLIEQAKLYRLKAETLANYAYAIHGVGMSPQRIAWSERPLLPTLGQRSSRIRPTKAHVRARRP